MTENIAWVEANRADSTVAKLAAKLVTKTVETGGCGCGCGDGSITRAPKSDAKRA